MNSIIRRDLPESALLKKYDYSGCYTDCYCTEVPGIVTYEEYISAFYTTWLFKFERFILKWAVSKPSSDLQALGLANGTADAFAAWEVEQRGKNQLLLTDYMGKTRSWLMVEHCDTANGRKTRLYFGSAVVPVKNEASDRPSMSRGFKMLQGFHKLYSVMLLRAAAKKLKA